MVVSGSYFNDADTISITGPGIATSAKPSGGGFRVTVAAPRGAGSYTITASKSGGYRAGLPKSTSFQVSAPAGSPGGGNQGSANTEQPSRQSFGEPGVTRSPSSGVQRSPSRSGGGQQQTSQPTAGVRGGGTTVTTGSGQQVFAGSAAPAPTTAGFVGGTTPGTTEPAGRSSGASAGQPSERAATSDAWSGFAPGRTASLTSAAGEPDGGTGSQLGLGIGLLALGLLALVAGLTAAEVRRRRAPAGR